MKPGVKVFAKTAEPDTYCNATALVARCMSCKLALRLVSLVQGMRCVYPLGRKMDVVELTEHDLSRLDDNEFLNDTVIDFYAK